VTTARAELLKLLTLPPLALTVALTWAVTTLMALVARGGPDPIPVARAGLLVLGVLAATSEYDGGQIHTTLLCTPRRARLHLTRTLVLALVTVPVALVTVLIAGTGDPVYLVLVTLLAAAVGTLLRHALAAVVAVLGYYYVIGPFIRDRFDDSLWLPAGWTAVAVLAATVAVVRRDA
jgi:ABC-2 type transport system permease protein